MRVRHEHNLFRSLQSVCAHLRNRCPKTVPFSQIRHLRLSTPIEDLLYPPVKLRGLKPMGLDHPAVDCSSLNEEIDKGGTGSRVEEDLVASM